MDADKWGFSPSATSWANLENVVPLLIRNSSRASYERAVCAFRTPSEQLEWGSCLMLGLELPWQWQGSLA